MTINELKQLKESEGKVEFNEANKEIALFKANTKKLRN